MYYAKAKRWEGNVTPSKTVGVRVNRWQLRQRFQMWVLLYLEVSTSFVMPVLYYYLLNWTFLVQLNPHRILSGSCNQFYTRFSCLSVCKVNENSNIRPKKVWLFNRNYYVISKKSRWFCYVTSKILAVVTCILNASLSFHSWQGCSAKTGVGTPFPPHYALDFWISKAELFCSNPNRKPCRIASECLIGVEMVAL